MPPVALSSLPLVSIPTDPVELVERVAAGDRRALSRAVSIIEDRRSGADDLTSLSYTQGSDAAVVGITGAPGAGKSSMVSRMISHLRSLDMSVAVLAVDPSSPFTGGAILGDRIRMQGHVGDNGVYVRSMSTRGHLGGVADATARTVSLLGVAGFDVVLVETVGVGQSETEIAESADTTIVVVTPGWGDSIQAAKAGLLEVADVFAINKSDLGGADEVERDLRAMLDLGTPTSWEPPIVHTSSTDGSGFDVLWDAVGEHRQWLATDARGRDRRRAQMSLLIQRAGMAELAARVGLLEVPAELIDTVLNRSVDPWTAARQLVS